tara:strand:+ start:481 stop:816 length:336 start_codon:yes stop_codon:yes gene_type:complete
MDLYKKFIYINPDTGAGEMDLSYTYPLASLQAVDIVDATSAVFVFYDADQADSTMVDVTITTGKCKEFCKEFAEHINYSKEAFIVLADAVAKEGFSALIDHDTAVTHTIGS